VAKAEQGFHEVFFGPVSPAVAVDEVELPFTGREDESVPSGHDLLLDPHLVIPIDHTVVPWEVDARSVLPLRCVGWRRGYRGSLGQSRHMREPEANRIHRGYTPGRYANVTRVTSPV
jgi:hypothetical protein